MRWSPFARSAASFGRGSLGGKVIGGRNSPGRDVPARVAATGLRISRDGLVSSGSQARAWLGLKPGSRLSPETLSGEMLAGAAAFDGGLKRLLCDGVAFEATVETRQGRVLAVVGAVDGDEADLALSDQTALRREAISADARARKAEQDLAAMAAAQEAAGLIAWRAAPDAETATWGSQGYDRLTIAERRELARAAAALKVGAATRSRAVIAGEDGAAAADGAPAAFDVFAVDHAADDNALRGERLFVARDAAAEMATEQAMRRLVGAMSDTFAHLTVGLMIFDADRRLALFNPAVAKLLDRDGVWLARRPGLPDVLDRMRKERVLPEQADYAKWRAGLVERAAGGDATSFQEVWHAPDGRAMMAIFRPHASGGLALLLEDITESLALRRRTASERAVRHATTDLLNEGVATFGEDGRVRKVNGAFRSIWAIDDDAPVEAEHVTDLIAVCEARSGPHRFWTALKAVVVGGGPRNASVDAFALPGGRVVSARISPLPDGSTLALFNDVTATEQVAVALKERNEALEQAEEMRCALVDHISHQLRTPLNSISGFAQLLAEGRVGPLTDVQREYVGGVAAGSEELLDVIDALPDLIALNGACDLETTAFDPEEALRDVVRLAEIRFRRRRCRIEARLFEADRGGPARRRVGGRGRLRQIAFNMLTDALSTIADGDGVRFAAEIRGDGLRLMCSAALADGRGDGPGAGRDVGRDAGRDATRGDDGPGRVEEDGEEPLSLALTIARRLARAPGGDLRVRLLEGDRGARRRILCDLPCGKEAPEDGDGENGSGPAPKPGPDGEIPAAPLVRAAGSR